MRGKGRLLTLSVFVLVLGIGGFSAFGQEAPPVITLIKPVGDCKIEEGSVMYLPVIANASGNVHTMVIYFDNEEQKRSSGPGISHLLNCAGLSAGSHFIRITADNGKTSEKIIALEVVYPDTVVTINPANIMAEKGMTLTLSATASRGEFTRLELAVDGALKKAVPRTDPGPNGVTSLAYALATAGMQVGVHQVKVTAKAGDGQVLTQATGTITLVEAAPSQPLSILIKEPSPGQRAVTKGAPVKVLAAAIGGKPGVHMALYLDGAKKADIANAALAYSIETARLSAGRHAIRITAKDSSGQLAKAEIIITVRPPLKMNKPVLRRKS